MKTFKVRNTEANKQKVLINGETYEESKNGKMLIVKVCNLSFPYLQGNVKKIKRALGF